MLSERVCDDLMLEVLSRLSVKSLFRLKRVSESWRDLVKDPFFIAKHLQLTTRVGAGCNNTKIHNYFLVGCRQLAFFFVYQSSKLSLNRLDLDLPLDIMRYRKLLGKTVHVLVKACVNGLVCLEYNVLDWMADDTSPEVAYVVLWNPSIRKFNVLPDSLSRPKPPLYYGPQGYVCYCFYGFHFNSDYKYLKFLRITMYLIRDTRELENRVEVCILRCAGDNDGGYSPSWREIDPAPRVSCELLDPLYIKGKSYWQFILKGKQFVLSFDFTDERFGLVSLPEPNIDGHQSHQEWEWTWMSQLEGSIAIFRCPQGNCRECFEIWLMRGGDGFTGTESWIKYLTVQNPKDKLYRHPLTFSSEGELLLQDDDLKLVLYKSAEQETDALAFPVYLARRQIPHKFIYSESLVSIKDFT